MRHSLKLDSLLATICVRKSRKLSGNVFIYNTRKFPHWPAYKITIFIISYQMFRLTSVMQSRCREIWHFLCSLWLWQFLVDVFFYAKRFSIFNLINLQFDLIPRTAIPLSNHFNKYDTNSLAIPCNAIKLENRTHKEGIELKNYCKFNKKWQKYK